MIESIKRLAMAGMACAMLAAPMAQAQETKPNILVIWGDDIGWQNVSAYGMGTMGYTTPAIDSIGLQGIRFTDHYAQPSSTAGRASFITGQYPIRSGMTTVGQFFRHPCLHIRAERETGQGHRQVAVTGLRFRQHSQQILAFAGSLVMVTFG